MCAKAVKGYQNIVKGNVASTFRNPLRYDIWLSNLLLHPIHIPEDYGLSKWGPFAPWLLLKWIR